jgi:hypothetical protein
MLETDLVISAKANRESSLQRAANIGSIHVVIRLAKVEPIKIPINETQHLDTQEDGKDSIKFKPKIDEGMVAGIKPVHETVRRGTTHYTSFGPTSTFIVYIIVFPFSYTTQSANIPTVRAGSNHPSEEIQCGRVQIQVCSKG